MATLRAVENRVYLVRAANTGISALIAPTGRILQQSDLFVEAVLSGTVTPGTAKEGAAKEGNHDNRSRKKARGPGGEIRKPWGLSLTCRRRQSGPDS
jgi:predicted amidohydrolase